MPALAIYAVPKSTGDLMRRGSSDRLPFPELVTQATSDPAIRDGVEKLYLLTGARPKSREVVRGICRTRRVVELSGSHDLTISSTREILQQIEAFARSL